MRLLLFVGRWRWCWSRSRPRSGLIRPSNDPRYYWLPPRRRQLKHFILDDRIVGLLGKLPIHHRLVPQIVRPIHGRTIWAGRRDNPMRLLRLIASRTRQRPLMIENRAEIAHVEITAARFTFPKMFGLAQARAADLLADDFPARDWRRHACDFSHACGLLKSEQADHQI